MTICQVMIRNCFMDGDGRYYNYKGDTEEKYSEQNLISGIDYCYWLLEAGLTRCSMNDYDLLEFIKWAKPQVTDIGELKRIEYRGNEFEKVKQ